MKLTNNGPWIWPLSFCTVEGRWSALTLHVLVHMWARIYCLIELNWDQQQSPQQRLKAENERSTQVAISIIKEQKWRRGGREEGWKEMICGVNPNWITSITSLFLPLFFYEFFFFFYYFISNIYYYPRFCARHSRVPQDNARRSSSLAAAGWLLTTTFL